ncbi:L-rhamnose mutarotase [Salinicola peritrichatus]|uniref:L-rhamnose mutarotase n=1 Tax=Salinicola peritrichatus TaxID=1267424 RepID=UPI000DA1480D|nr:L-rhamnose mutarotase [Salinicola peritrichatus]
MPIRAFRMNLHPGQAEEYRRRHDAIWPELTDALHAAGIEEYRIFLDPDSHHLFAIMTLADDHRVEELPALPIMRRWWHHMAGIMETRDDDAPVEVALEEMFALGGETKTCR